MTAWHRTWQADIGLRILGLACCGVAYVALTHLVAVAHPAPHHHAGPLAHLIAAIGFLAASAGSALALLGKHLFDRIEISARWRVRRPAESDPR